MRPKSTSLLGQACHYKNELIIPVRHEIDRPNGFTKIGFGWFTVDADTNIVQEKEEEYSSLEGAIEVAKRNIDLNEARINFAF